MVRSATWCTADAVSRHVEWHFLWLGFVKWMDGTPKQKKTTVLKIVCICVNRAKTADQRSVFG